MLLVDQTEIDDVARTLQIVDTILIVPIPHHIIRLIAEFSIFGKLFLFLKFHVRIQIDPISILFAGLGWDEERRSSHVNLGDYKKQASCQQTGSPLFFWAVANIGFKTGKHFWTLGRSLPFHIGQAIDGKT